MSVDPEDISKAELVIQYKPICLAAVAQVLGLLGASTDPASNFKEYVQRFDRARSALGGGEAVAMALGINKEQATEFATALRRVMRIADNISSDPYAQSNEAIALLQLADQLQRIKDVRSDLTFNLQPLNFHPAPSSLHTERQVRALELIIRGLINQAYGSQDKLLERLNEIYTSQLSVWKRVADKDDILSGTLFSDLSNIFVNQVEYAAHYNRLYRDTPYLAFLDEKRKTLIAFLSDIRYVRNRIAHHKTLSDIQVTLVDLYYREIVEPVQEAFDRGSSAVNPDSFSDASAADLKAHFAKVEKSFTILGEDIGLIRDDISEVKLTVTAIQADTSWLRKHAIVLTIGIVAVGVVGFLTLGATTGTLANTFAIRSDVKAVNVKMTSLKLETSSDPRKELANRGIAWDETSLGWAIERGEPETVKLFLDGGMRWRMQWYAFRALDRGDKNIIKLLTNDKKTLLKESSDCKSLMNHLARVDPASTSTESEANERPHILTLDEKTMLKIVCDTPTDLAEARKNYEERRQVYVDSLSEYQLEKASLQQVDKCVAELSERNFELLLIEAARFRGREWPSGPTLYDGLKYDIKTLGINRLGSDDVNDRAKIRKLVTEYCNTRAASEPDISISPASYLSRKQILDAL